LDEALYHRILQATLRIAPEGNQIVGCGVLIDSKEKLVVTHEAVMGDRESASACLASAHCVDAEGLIDASAKSNIVAKVVFRLHERHLILLRLETWPEGAAVLPLGEWTHSPGQTLHAVYHQAPNPSALAEWLWSYGCGRVRQIIMTAHY
jgi:hypothetical protein